MLAALHVAANAIAGEQRWAAEQGVAGPLEEHLRRQVLHREAVRRKPGVEVRRLAGADLVAEARAEEAIVEHQPGVGREHQVGQARLRRHQFDLYAEADERVVEPTPLRTGALGRTAARHHAVGSNAKCGALRPALSVGATLPPSKVKNLRALTRYTVPPSVNPAEAGPIGGHFLFDP